MSEGPSKWRHVICARCYFRKNEAVDPEVGREESEEVRLCCYCHQRTHLFFWVRAAPELVPCQGFHADEKKVH